MMDLGESFGYELWKSRFVEYKYNKPGREIYVEYKNLMFKTKILNSINKARFLQGFFNLRRSQVIQAYMFLSGKEIFARMHKQIQEQGENNAN